MLGTLHTPMDCPSRGHQIAAGEGGNPQGASRPSPSLCSIGQHQQLPVRLLPAAPHMLRVDPPGGFNCRRHAQREATVEQQPPSPLTHSPPLPPIASESVATPPSCVLSFIEGKSEDPLEGMNSDEE